MSKFAKYGLIWASGAIVGAVSTYFGVKKYFEEKYEADRREIEDFYRGKAEEKEKKNEESKSTNNGYSRDSMIDRLNRLTEYPEIDRSKYVNYSDMYGGDNLSDEDEVSREAKDVMQVQSMSEHPAEETLPHIIDEDEFTNPIPAYEKITLEYYMDDDILIDSLSHEVQDVSKTVTEANIDALRATDDEYIYVRNDSRSEDYEVVKIWEDYEEAQKGYYGIY